MELYRFSTKVKLVQVISAQALRPTGWESESSMLTVTFYSFRGGVRRTMALAERGGPNGPRGIEGFLDRLRSGGPGLSLTPEFRPAEPSESDDGLVGYPPRGA